MRQHGDPTESALRALPEPEDVVSLFGLESIADGRKALAGNQHAARVVAGLILERTNRGESAEAVARERRRLECVQSRIAALERFVADRVQGRIAAGAQRDPGPGAALVAELLRLAPSARPAPAQPPAQHAGGSEAELAAELMQFQSTVPPGGQPPERFIVPSGGRT